MTGVPRLQHLPIPAAPAGAAAVAVPQTRSGQRVQEVLPVLPVQRDAAQLERRPAGPDGNDRGGIEDAARRGRASARPDGQPNLSGRSGGQGGGEAAAGRLVNFSRLSSMPFLVQVLGQMGTAGRSQPAALQGSLAGHRDAALLGSDVYRRAGGEPELLPDSATFVRLAV